LLAMESVNRRLVRRDARLIQLLDPPFDNSPLNPGPAKMWENSDAASNTHKTLPKNLKAPGSIARRLHIS
jgi:hypothetical protein